MVKQLDVSDVVDKSLDRIIESEDGDYIMQVIRQDYLADSTVTVFLIGNHSSEMEGIDWYGRPINYFIQRELQASLYNGNGNTRNGILGVVLPSMYNEVYKGSYICTTCGCSHNWVAINDNTVIREFSSNYYIEPHEGCAWSENERYCMLVRWDEFVANSEYYIDLAFTKRENPIAKKIRIRNLR